MRAGRLERRVEDGPAVVPRNRRTVGDVCAGHLVEARLVDAELRLAANQMWPQRAPRGEGGIRGKREKSAWIECLCLCART